ncbi:DUF4239 domain-containing protein [Kaistia dalseonensis]|uniref:DUF4239 domain-containing protein n=1 Tax=Kaistia dalseonensis TaxID=410840 RepID=A0ABU0H3V4_9HYPH|nr:DUF4239 domain-containing protein [Kaistia dalseonensis]MCX5494402.1 DUF4239 domain-containing protein [Kaistia dalseonensis]MDQ0436981.1 hypothetical protein [Kaistia dalseonensis]
MYPSFIERLSDLQLLLLFPVVACLVLTLLTVALRLANEKLHWLDYDSDIVDTATQNTMSGAYVVLGFVLALVMATASGIDDKVSQEAQSIRGLNRMLILDGSEPALKARQSLIDYAQSILRDEWPVLRQGHGSSLTSSALTGVFQNIDRINPQTPEAVAVFGRILDAADRVAQGRNDRILSVATTLPGMFYTVSLLSILGVIIICALRLIEATTLRVITLTVQLIMLTLMLGAIAIIDLPYLGDTRISAESLTTVYDALVAQDPILHQGED